MSLKLYIKWHVKSAPSKGAAEELWVKDKYASKINSQMKWKRISVYIQEKEQLLENNKTLKIEEFPK